MGQDQNLGLAKDRFQSRVIVQAPVVAKPQGADTPDLGILQFPHESLAQRPAYAGARNATAS